MSVEAPEESETVPAPTPITDIPSLADIETPRLLEALSERESSRELRKSVEGCIEAIMGEQAVLKTDPTIPDDDDANPSDDNCEEEDPPHELREDKILITALDDAVEGNDETEQDPHVPSLNLAAATSEQDHQIGYSDEELSAAFRKFQEKHRLPPPEMRGDVLSFASSLCEQAIDDEDYDLAEKLEHDVTEYKRMCREASADPSDDWQLKNAETRLEEVRQKQAMCEYEWEQRIADLKQREQAKIEEIERKQEEERQAFEAKCQTPEFLQRFTKPSAALRQLWRLQKGLALQHNFEGAKEVKQRAEELQRQETEEAQKRAMKSIQRNYEKLIVKQKREIECANANTVRKVQQMEVERTKDKEVKEKLNRQVESRLKERRQPLKKSTLPPLSANSREATPSYMTRRARNRGNLQADAPSQALDIKIPNIKAVIGTKGRKTHG